VNYGDSDLILTLYTRDHGKISALARSARKSKRRFGASIGLFAVSTVDLRQRGSSELWTISSAHLDRDFTPLASDIGAVAHAGYALELIRELSAAEQPDVDLYDLVVELYETLDEFGPTAMALRAFEMRLLNAVGLAPVLENCVGARSDGDHDLERGAVLDPHRGGATCSRCAATARGLGVRPLSDPARRILAASQRFPSLADAARAELRGPEPAEARDASLALLLHHVGKPLKSVEFIAKLSASLNS
jgi:DNA repair protein RecO (recombination protein O)